MSLRQWVNQAGRRMVLRSEMSSLELACAEIRNDVASSNHLHAAPVAPVQLLDE